MAKLKPSTWLHLWKPPRSETTHKLQVNTGEAYEAADLSPENSKETKLFSKHFWQAKHQKSSPQVKT